MSRLSGHVLSGVKYVEPGKGEEGEGGERERRDEG